MNSLELWPVVQGGMYRDKAVQIRSLDVASLAWAAWQYFGSLDRQDSTSKRRTSVRRRLMRVARVMDPDWKLSVSWICMSMDLYTKVCTDYILSTGKYCRGCCFMLYGCGKQYCVSLCVWHVCSAAVVLQHYISAPISVKHTCSVADNISR